MWSGRKHSRKRRSSGLRRTSITRILTVSVITEDNRLYSALQSTLSRHQSSRAWQCHGFSGSLAISTHAANRRFLMILADTAGTTSTRISSLGAFRAATAARKMCRTPMCICTVQPPSTGLRVWECSKDRC